MDRELASKERLRTLLQERQLREDFSPEEAARSWEQQRFVARARALFYARLMFLTLGLLILAVPPWAEHFGLGGPVAFAVYLFMLLYSIANFTVIQHPVAGRWMTYTTLCLDMVAMVVLIARPQVGGGLQSPFLATELLFTALFALLFPKPLAILPPLLALLVTERLDLLLYRRVTAVELLTVFWYLGINCILVYVLVYLNERESATQREVVGLQSELKELAVIEERNRLAREIHDGLGASLSSLIIQSEYLLKIAQDGALREELVELKACAEDAIEELRRNLRMMREDFELGQALEDYIKTFRERTQLNIAFQVSGPTRKMSPDAQLTFFRVLQESLANAAKHAEAHRLAVKLAFETDRVLLSIQDDGRGFTPGQIPEGHYGLVHMRERAAKMGGDIIIDSKPGAGTHITVFMPVRG